MWSYLGNCTPPNFSCRYMYFCHAGYSPGGVVQVDLSAGWWIPHIWNTSATTRHSWGPRFSWCSVCIIQCHICKNYCKKNKKMWLPVTASALEVLCWPGQAKHYREGVAMEAFRAARWHPRLKTCPRVKQVSAGDKRLLSLCPCLGEDNHYLFVACTFRSSRS